MKMRSNEKFQQKKSGLENKRRVSRGNLTVRNLKKTGFHKKG